MRVLATSGLLRIGQKALGIDQIPQLTPTKLANHGCQRRVAIKDWTAHQLKKKKKGTGEYRLEAMD